MTCQGKTAAHLRGSGGALDRVDVLFRDLIDRRFDRAHGETLRFNRVDIIERGVEVKPPFQVAEHHGHAVVIGRDQLIRLVGQDREGRNRFAFHVRIIPDVGEHAPCCARAATGHAAAPPSRVIRPQVDCRGGATNEVGPPRAKSRSGALIPYSYGGRFN
jgi:hypothetical protein